MSQTTYGTDDGFRRALADANRMRLRQIGAATCATALAVALTGSLVPAQQSTGKSRLDMVTVPETPRPASVPSLSASPSAAPSPAVAPPAAGPGTATGPATVRRPADVARSDTPGTRPARPVRRLQSTKMTRNVSGLVPDFGCTFAATSWCFRAIGDMKESPAHVRWLQADLCARPGGSTVMKFPTSAEIEMTVLDARGRVLWSWLADHPAARQPHAVVYSAGVPCLRWTTKWLERTNAGVPVGPGKYRLVVKFLGTAPAGIPASAVDFRL